VKAATNEPESAFDELDVQVTRRHTIIFNRYRVRQADNAAFGATALFRQAGKYIG
jgi:hypothetical protein